MDAMWVAQGRGCPRNALLTFLPCRWAPHTTLPLVKDVYSRSQRRLTCPVSGFSRSRGPSGMPESVSLLPPAWLPP